MQYVLCKLKAVLLFRDTLNSPDTLTGIVLNIGSCIRGKTNFIIFSFKECYSAFMCGGYDTQSCPVSSQFPQSLSSRDIKQGRLVSFAVIHLV